MLKRAGRGHLVDGPATTPPGGLAIECPACPQPGQNLPVWWKTVPLDMKCVVICNFLLTF